MVKLRANGYNIYANSDSPIGFQDPKLHNSHNSIYISHVSLVMEIDLMLSDLKKLIIHRSRYMIWVYICGLMWSDWTSVTQESLYREEVSVPSQSDVPNSADEFVSFNSVLIRKGENIYQMKWKKKEKYIEKCKFHFSFSEKWKIHLSLSIQWTRKESTFCFYPTVKFGSLFSRWIERLWPSRPRALFSISFIISGPLTSPHQQHQKRELHPGSFFSSHPIQSISFTLEISLFPTSLCVSV